MIHWFSRFPSIFLASVFAVPSLGLAQTAPPPAAEDGVKKRVMELLGEAHNLKSDQQRRYLDALSKIDEAEALDPNNPEVYNQRGAIYLIPQVRQIDQARANFTKARDLTPDKAPSMFNLAETEFVAGNFAAAELAFADLVEKFPRLPKSMRHLSHFKIIVSMAKQKKLGEAESHLTKHFTFLDDTPAYYFAKAVIAIENKRSIEGNEWMAKAQVIFMKPADKVPYLDALKESHYVFSIDVPAPATAKP